MHEWSLAEAVVDTSVNLARQSNFKNLSKVVIRIGELQQIEEDIFRFALNEILEMKGNFAKNTKIEIIEEEVRLKCRVCGYEWEDDEIFDDLEENEKEAIHFLPETSHVYTSCPQCGSTDFEIIKGRGLYIDSISGDRHD